MTIRVVAQGLDHPECVTVDSSGRLYCGGEDGQLYLVNPDTGAVEEISKRGGLILGICVNGRGTIYACDATNSEVYARLPDGSTRTVSSGTSSRPMNIPNFPVLDDRGWLYVSDSGSWPEGGGCIFKISPEGQTSIWTTQSSSFTNGLALSPDGSYLYVAESLLPGVTRIPILPDGAAGVAELVCLMPGTVPDGLAFDAEGGLYVACYRPDRVYRIDLDGNLKIVADDFQGTDLAAPTNVVFGGKNRTTLYLASLARWHIAAMSVDIPGSPLNFPTNSFEPEAN
jgi:gluconolactonase